MTVASSTCVRETVAEFASRTWPASEGLRQVGARLISEASLESSHARLESLRRFSDGAVPWKFKQSWHALLYFRQKLDGYRGFLAGEKLRYHVSSSDRLCFIAADTEWDGCVDISGDYSYFVVFVDPAFIDRNNEDIDRKIAPASCFGFHDPWITQGFARLEAEIDVSDGASRMMLEGWALQMSAQLQRRTMQRGRSSSAGSQLSKTGLDRVLDCMRANLAGDVQLMDLSRLVGLSERQFLRAFQGSTGSTPARTISDMRLERAAELLCDADRSITTIALDCGFSQPQHLATAFKRKFGTTPSKFRSQL